MEKDEKNRQKDRKTTKDELVVVESLTQIEYKEINEFNLELKTSAPYFNRDSLQLNRLLAYLAQIKRHNRLFGTGTAVEFNNSPEYQVIEHTLSAKDYFDQAGYHPYYPLLLIAYIEDNSRVKLQEDYPEKVLEIIDPGSDIPDYIQHRISKVVPIGQLRVIQNAGIDRITMQNELIESLRQEKDRLAFMAGSMAHLSLYLDELKIKNIAMNFSKNSYFQIIKRTLAGRNCNRRLRESEQLKKAVSSLARELETKGIRLETPVKPRFLS